MKKKERKIREVVLICNDTSYVNTNEIDTDKIDTYI